MHRATHRTGRIVGHRDGYAECGHDGVAYVLDDKPVVVYDYVLHERKVFVKQFHRCRSAQPFRYGGEGTDVTEQQSRLLANPAAVAAAIGQLEVCYATRTQTFKQFPHGFLTRQIVKNEHDDVTASFQAE